MYREANFDKVAAELRKMGLEARNTNTGGGIYCVVVYLTPGLMADVEINFGTAAALWCGAVWMDGQYADIDLWTECRSSHTNAKFVAKELYFAIERFLIGQ